MSWNHALFWAFLGWLLVFATKYLLVGLRQWDTLFHPERLSADTTGPYKQFSSPFLGIFQ